MNDGYFGHAVILGVAPRGLDINYGIHNPKVVMCVKLKKF
jgi:hypothetical protein